MGHLAGNYLYKRVQKKLDGITTRLPWNGNLHILLKELFSEEEANLFIKLPYNFSTLERIGKVTKYKIPGLKATLSSMCDKGLVMDFWVNGEYQYCPSPMVLGIFEFVMMKIGNGNNINKLGKLFNDYFKDGLFYKKNFNKGYNIGSLRVIPHEEAINNYVEILDYDKALELISGFDKFCVGNCSCRHEKLHAGNRKCNYPLDTCSIFGKTAEFQIRHEMGKEVSKEEMIENVLRAKEEGLVLQVENVKNNIAVLCQCCGCCCKVLTGFNNFGFHNTIVTSRYIAEVNKDNCTGCGLCKKACHIDAIEISPIEFNSKTKKIAIINTETCIGCGVCALACNFNALILIKRKQKILTPENAFERVILQSLDKGTLQNLIFDDCTKWTHQSLQLLVGAFLKLPLIKKTLMKDKFKSQFLSAFIEEANAKGAGWLTDF